MIEVPAILQPDIWTLILTLLVLWRGHIFNRHLELFGDFMDDVYLRLNEVEKQ